MRADTSPPLQPVPSSSKNPPAPSNLMSLPQPVNLPDPPKPKWRGRGPAKTYEKLRSWQRLKDCKNPPPAKPETISETDELEETDKFSDNKDDEAQVHDELEPKFSELPKCPLSLQPAKTLTLGARAYRDGCLHVGNIAGFGRKFFQCSGQIHFIHISHVTSTFASNVVANNISFTFQM